MFKILSKVSLYILYPKFKLKNLKFLCSLKIFKKKSNIVKPYKFCSSPSLKSLSSKIFFIKINPDIVYINNVYYMIYLIYHNFELYIYIFIGIIYNVDLQLLQNLSISLIGYREKFSDTLYNPKAINRSLKHIITHFREKNREKKILLFAYLCIQRDNFASKA